MLNGFVVSTARERYDDYAREAEYERLVRQLSAQRSSGDRLCHRLLAQLGCLLIAAGKHLQERYGAAARIPGPLAASQ